MLDAKFWKMIFQEQGELDVARRKIIGASSDAQHLSKQVIFALQRDNVKEAREKLTAARELLVELDKKYGQNGKLRNEGAWKAGIEEFVEAKLFFDFCDGKKIGGVKEFYVELDEYLGGLSDLTGELVRLMIILATQKKFDEVKKAGQAVDEVIHALMQNNLTGYLRTKFDQAKNSLRKAEEILYEISMKK
ncbi:hypothetical protein HZB94_01105 [Candidatus Falkowbacteria bacterium]|nr:hypothetical protein [Candidatus Falkowbacteria bacterium]